MSKSTTATAVLEMPCLGRPFGLGMLYNCHNDQLIPGKTLWGSEALEKVAKKRPQPSSDFEVIAEDTLSEKTLRLEVSGSLKLSLLGGLVKAGGAAKYLYDQKSSKRQARVSLKYKTTSSFEQLSMDQLGQIEYPNVFDDGIATHVVTAVLYGADAFFVFDREVAEDERYHDVHGEMKLLIKALPAAIAEIGGGASVGIQSKQGNALEKFQCKFYGDIILPNNPSTYQDAVKTYEELPSLLGGEGYSYPKSVPKKVWLLPLSNLDSRGQRIVRNISVGLVTDVEKLMEDLHEFEMQINDLMKKDVCSHFMGIKDKLQRALELISGYRLKLVESLGTLLPQIRGGGAGEVKLAEVLRERNESPFSRGCLSSWISGMESEVKFLTGYLKKIEEQPIRLAFGEMDVLISDVDLECFLCFDFNVAGRVDGHIQKMDAYLRKASVQELPSPNPWYKSQKLMQDMRLQLRLFMDFVQANAGSKDVQYVVTDSSTEATAESSQVAVVTLYENGVDSLFELPAAPGKPQASDVTDRGLKLEWSKPKHGARNVQSYVVSYCSLDDPQDVWHSNKASGVQEDLVFSRLAPQTVYFFKVRAETAAGTSPESEVSDPIETKPSPLQLGCKKISKPGEHPEIYKLPVQGAKKQGDLAWCTVGESLPFATAVPHKVLMVVGATGAGKSTLINGIVNYIWDVQWEDDHRYKLITDEGGRSQAHSQTKCITSYTFHHKKGSPLPFTLTVIDTPGFGDTEGLERDKRLVSLIKQLFSTRSKDTGIDHLDAIGFVVQASLARLTHTQKYIFDAVLSIFGKDISNNIFLMTTFADGDKPPVMEAVKAAGIPNRSFFKFNNSALFRAGEDEFDQMFWKMGTQSFKSFFTALSKVDSRSLHLTREVLQEREHLETVIESIQPKIRASLSKMDELRQEERILKEREAEILTNKDFTYKIDVTKQRKVNLRSGVYTTNCLKCNFTCHDNCAYPNDGDKYMCAAMGTNRNTRSACCGACPGRCSWRDHVNNPFKFVVYQEKETRTSADLKTRYESAMTGKGKVEAMIATMNDELESLNEAVLGFIVQARQSLNRLDEIALRPNPLSEVEYIDLLIESEKQEAKPGFMNRIKALQEVREQAKFMSALKKEEVAAQVAVQSKGFWERFKFWN